MNNGWIKLHRKINDKGLMRDHLAYIIFSWLLINVNRDGSRRIGRYTVCDELGINPNTYYKVIKRLEKKWNVIRIESTKLYSTVWIVNWAKYQHEENTHDNQETNSVQSADNEKTTKQEYKNTRIKNREYLTNFPLEDFFDIEASEKQIRLEAEKALNWLLANNKTKSNYKAFLRNWVLKVYKKKTTVIEEPKYEIDAAGIARIKEMKSKFNLN